MIGAMTPAAERLLATIKHDVAELYSVVQVRITDISGTIGELEAELRQAGTDINGVVS